MRHSAGSTAAAHVGEDALQLDLPAQQASIIGVAEALHFLDTGLHQASRRNVAGIAQLQRIGLLRLPATARGPEAGLVEAEAEPAHLALALDAPVLRQDRRCAAGQQQQAEACDAAAQGGLHARGFSSRN